MKKLAGLMAVALLLASTSAFAATSELTGGLQGGVHIPSGDYGDVAKMGYLGGVFLDYHVNPTFSVGASLDYNTTKAKDAVLAPGIDEIKFTIFNYGVNGAVNLMKEGTAIPYVKVGAGMYSIKSKTSGTLGSGETTDTKFGFDGGAGVMVRPSGSQIGFGVEGLVHNVSDGTKNSSGDKASAMFINVTGRVTFSFSDASQKK